MIGKGCTIAQIVGITGFAEDGGRKKTGIATSINTDGKDPK
jgi:hypothetical protein